MVEKKYSLTSFIISLITIILFFVGMPFLGTYFLHPSENYKYVFLIIFLSVLLVTNLIGLIFGIVGIRKGKNPYNTTGIIINTIGFIANLGMMIFLVYIQFSSN
ncbi:MAG: hypothetical protein ACTSXA_06580 [Candidatus Heimdallarchaeota archaeon]